MYESKDPQENDNINHSVRPTIKLFVCYVIMEQC